MGSIMTPILKGGVEEVKINQNKPIVKKLKNNLST